MKRLLDDAEKKQQMAFRGTACDSKRSAARGGGLWPVPAFVTALALFAAPLTAQAAPDKPGKTVNHTVKITNKRTSPVVTFSLVPHGQRQDGAANQLKSPLEPGKSATLTFAGKGGECVYDIFGSYADDTEIAGEGLDVCKNKVLTLVD